MSADLLRQAAAKMRERAGAAGHEWNADVEPGASLHLWVTDYDPSDHTGQTAMQRLVGGADAPWSEHIASWSPDVALAVADLLDFAAEAFFGGILAEANIEHIAKLPMPARCIAVARAYLGGA